MSEFGISPDRWDMEMDRDLADKPISNELRNQLVVEGNQLYYPSTMRVIDVRHLAAIFYHSSEHTGTPYDYSQFIEKVLKRAVEDHIDLTSIYRHPKYSPYIPVFDTEAGTYGILLSRLETPQTDTLLLDIRGSSSEGIGGAEQALATLGFPFQQRS